MRITLKSYNYQALMVKVFDKIQENYRQVGTVKRSWLKWVVKLEKKIR